MSQPLTRDEQALEEMIAQTGKLLVVCLAEPHHPGSLLMLERLRHLCEPRPGVQVLHLGFTPYRRWARRHRSFGTPTVLIFRQGILARRYAGLIEEDVLEECLRDLE